MRKILFVLLISLSVTCLGGFVRADVEFSVSAKVDFDASTVTVSIDTPAHYGQNILVTIYKQDENITLPTQYIRINDVYASREGSASLVFNLSDLDTGFYTVSASGGGYLAELCRDKVDFYFETTDDVNNITLPAISVVEDDELDEMLVKLNLNFDIDLGVSYSKDKNEFIKYFENVRKDDFNDCVNSIGEVQEIADRVNLIMITIAASKQSDIDELYEENSVALSFDKSSDEYTDNKSSIYKIYLHNIYLNKNNIKDLSDIRLILKQSIGMAVINEKNAKNITGVIEKYGELYGIPTEEYQEYCAKYSEISMNKNFVGRNFTTPDEVLKAYNDAVSAVKKASEKDISPAVKNTRGTTGVYSGNTNTNNTSTNENPQIFNDVPKEHWAYQYINALSDIGVINGFEDGSFKPENTVTREQFIKMLVKAFKISDNGEASQKFLDVPEGHWAEPFIRASVQNGIVNGASETEFGFGSNITRQDAVVLIARIANIEKTGSDDISNAFTDWGDVADYAIESVSKLYNAGIISGIGNGIFAPLSSITRAQAAKILYCVLLSV